MSEERVEFMMSFIERCDRAKKRYIVQAEHARFLHDTILERWEPGTDSIIPSETTINDSPATGAEPMVKGIVRDARNLLLRHDPIVKVGAYNEEHAHLASSITVHLYAAWVSRLTRAMHTIRFNEYIKLLCGLEFVSVQPYVDAGGELHFLIEHVPRNDFWAEPSHIDIENRIVVRRYWWSAKEAHRQFGSDAESVIDRSTHYHKPRHDDIFDYSTYDNSRSGEDEPPNYWRPDDDGMLPVYEMWIPFRDLDPDLFTDDEINESPYGRRLTFIEEQEMENIPNPNARQGNRVGSWIGHKSHPYVANECFRKIEAGGYSGLYSCEGIVHDVEQIQWEVNELTRMAYIAAAREAEPIYWVARGQTRETDFLAHRPGAKFYYDPMVTGGPPVQIRSANIGAILELRRQRKEGMRDTSGMRGPIIGGDPVMGTSHTPVGTMAQVQESSTIRLWGPLANTEWLLHGVMWRMMGLMQLWKSVGSYSSVNMYGTESYAEWTDANVYADYRLDVVHGMTAATRDIDRINMASQIFNTVGPILANVQAPPSALRAVEAYLVSLNDPHTYEYMKLVRELLAEQEQQLQQPQFQQGGEQLQPYTNPFEVALLQGQGETV